MRSTHNEINITKQRSKRLKVSAFSSSSRFDRVGDLDVIRWLCDSGSFLSRYCGGREAIVEVGVAVARLENADGEVRAEWN